MKTIKRASGLTIGKYAVDMGGDKLAMANPSGLATVDTGRCSAYYTISTPTQDRDGDVMEPMGCNLENYRLSPVALYDHGEEYSLPIGLCETPAPEKTCTVRPSSGNVTAEIFFHQRTAFAADVANLVMADVLRACSVGFKPIKATKIYNDQGKHTGWHFEEWELTELSVTPVGANPEALRRHLARGSVVTKSLQRRLEPFAERRRILVNGAGPMASVYVVEKGKVVKKDKAKDKPKERDADFGDDQIDGSEAKPGEGTDHDEDFGDDTIDAKDAPKKSEEKDEDFGDDKLDDKDADGKSDDEENKPKEEKDDDDEEEVTKDDLPKKTGAAHVASHIAHATGSIDYSTKAEASEGDPDIIALLQEDMAHEKEKIAKWSELFATKYPDYDLNAMMTEHGPKAAPVDDDEDEDDDSELDSVHKGKRLKTVLVKRFAKRHKSICKDAADFLEEAGGDDKIHKMMRGGCKYHGKALSDMVREMDEPDNITKDEDMDVAADQESKALLLTLRKAAKRIAVA